MNKKTIAFVLLGIGALGVIIYLVMNKKGTLSSGSGTGSTPFEKDDLEAYNKIKAMVSSTTDYSWAATLVTQRWSSNPTMVYGQPSRALTLHSVLSEVAPNNNGKYPASSWSGGKPLLWPDSDFAKMWQIKTDLENKYSPINN